MSRVLYGMPAHCYSQEGIFVFSPTRNSEEMSPRNEALDCRVYAMSAFTLLNADLNQIMEKFLIHEEVIDLLISIKVTDANSENKWRVCYSSFLQIKS